jgi:hypothetical protein
MHCLRVEQLEWPLAQTRPQQLQQHRKLQSKAGAGAAYVTLQLGE